MPRPGKLTIIVGGSMLCAATAASTSAATWPAGTPATAAHQGAAEEFFASGVPPAIAASHPGQAPVNAAEATEAIGFQVYRATALRRAHALAAASAARGRAVAAAAARAQAVAAAAARAHAAHTAHTAHEAYLAQEARRAQAARQAAADAQPSQQPVSQQPVFRQSVSVSVEAEAGAGRLSGSSRQIAQQMLAVSGQAGQFSCLDSLWNRESGWSITAQNPTSGAYGIPQALPGFKMASAGADWATNAATQIRWGLSYIDGLYGSPCGAWSHEEAMGWY